MTAADEKAVRIELETRSSSTDPRTRSTTTNNNNNPPTTKSGKVENGFRITWHEMCYAVFPKFWHIGKKAKYLLNHVSGQIYSGQMVALMGPSGCGKSTLLNTIAMRNPDNITAGTITITGNVKKVKICLVPQTDEFYDRFSVKETIMYASKLKNPEFTLPQHERTVVLTMKALGLDICENVKVHKCSGGQKKRVSVAQELVARPNILLLDEPTSGLDSSSCFQLLSLLSKLCHDRSDEIVIMMSIHQPSTRLFNLFDHVYFLAHRGICVYEGPPTEVGTRVAQTELKMPTHCNPSDFMMEVASHDYGSNHVVKLNELQRQPYEASDAPNYALTESSLSSKIQKPSHQFFYHAWLVFERSWKASIRDPILMIVRLVGHIITPITLGYLFGLHIGQELGCPRPSLFSLDFGTVINLLSDADDRRNEIYTIMGNINFLYGSALLTCMLALCVAGLIFPVEGKILEKEFRNGCYSLTSYFIGRSITDIILQSVLIFVYVIVGWVWTSQIWSYTRFFGMIIMFVEVTICAQTIGYSIGSIFMDHLLASAFCAMVISLPIVLYTSLFVRIKDMSAFVYSVAQISYFQYAFEGLIASVYGFGSCICNNATSVAVPDVPNSTAPELSELSGQPRWITQFGRQWNAFVGSYRDDDPEFNFFENEIRKMDKALGWSSNCSEYKPFAMNEFDVTDETFYQSLLVLGLMIIFFRIISFSILKIKLT